MTPHQRHVEDLLTLLREYAEAAHMPLSDAQVEQWRDARAVRAIVAEGEAWEPPSVSWWRRLWLRLTRRQAPAQRLLRPSLPMPDVSIDELDRVFLEAGGDE